MPRDFIFAIHFAFLISQTPSPSSSNIQTLEIHTYRFYVHIEICFDEMKGKDRSEVILRNPVWNCFDADVISFDWCFLLINNLRFCYYVECTCSWNPETII